MSTNYQTLVKQSRLYPILLLESWLSRRVRRVVLYLGIGVLLLILLVALSSFVYKTIWLWPLLGVASIWLGLLLFLELWELYFRSYYYPSIISNEYHRRDLFTFTVGRILYASTTGDLLSGFIASETGQRILARCGVIREELAQFLATRQRSLPFLTLPQDKVFTLHDLVDWLINNESGLSEWLLAHEIQAVDLLAATDWVVYEIERAARRERWWSRERLATVQPLADNLAYGGTYKLEKYSEDVSRELGAGAQVAIPEDLLSRVRDVLARHSESNAVLVGDKSMLLAVVWGLAQAWRQPRFVIFQHALLFAQFKEKTELEREILKVFKEAVSAGNIVLVLQDLPNFITQAESRGISLIELLDPFLANSGLPVIALADPSAFHQYIEADVAWLSRFEKVTVAELPLASLLTVLRERILKVEEREKVFFTYPAAFTLLQAADQYFAGETANEKADDLLQELIPYLQSRAIKLVTKQDVLSFITGKTDIPLGEIGADERDKLIQLEERLRQRVVGQEAAIVAISNALRRSRTGLRTPNKPIGSFLFLGPTGVGKTETAKALASVFFGDERKLLRLDMSEYQSSEALERLIGSFTNNRPGILANLLRENPYGVVLIDEFEKADRNVLNLFLQILDEGFFSDMMGKRVNARNVIFIATSNAGANLIWDLVAAGKDPAAAREELINHLVSNNYYKPELLNRFDDTIIFHPLGEVELTQVARLQLGRLNQRLRAQGLQLAVTDSLLQHIVTKGSNRVFGARPMLRFIQDNIEQSIAKAIIAGQVRAGAKIEFDVANNTIREMAA